MKDLFLVFTLVTFSFASVSAQTTDGLVAYYSFDNCDAADEVGTAPDGVISGNPGCGCGPVGNALYFDGQNDYIEFLSDYGDLLSQNFTASFYIAPENLTGIVDIFSKRVACRPDSAVAVRYEPATSTLRCELTEGITERVVVQGRLPDNRCWVHVAWVRDNPDLRLYFDGVLVGEETIQGQIDARNMGIFSIANSPCLANGEFRYFGGMDEFRVYNRALTAEEVQELVVPFDRLVTRDTVVFQGSSVPVVLERSCAPDYLWSPPNGVSDTEAPEPILTPDRTTTYTLTIDYGFCMAEDTIRVIVVDSTELDCEDVFLPNAFTPNQDGLNDEFGVSNDNFFLADFQSMQIYDRWGGLLFEGLSVDQKWDGTINGEQALPGVYVYKVRFQCDGRDQISTGSFNLLR